MNNSEYINTFLPLDTQWGPNQIYPICTDYPNTIATGNINETMKNGPDSSEHHDHRWNLAIGNHWGYPDGAMDFRYHMQPENRSTEWPLTLKLLNYPINNTMDLLYIGTNNGTVFIQNCQYQSFSGNNGLDILLAVDDYNEHLILTELYVAYYRNTESPTVSPSGMYCTYLFSFS